MATTKFYHGKVKYKLGYFTQYRHCHRHHHLHHYDNDNNNNYYFLSIIRCLLTSFVAQKLSGLRKNLRQICLIKALLR